MKNLLLILFVLIACNSYGQEKSTPIILGGVKFTAKSMTVDSSRTIISLFGNVQFESEKVKLKADTVIFNKATNKVIAKGVTNVISTPRMTVAKNSTNKTLKFTVGEDMVYIE